MPRGNEADDKQLPAEMSEDKERESTIHSLFEPSEEIATNFLDHKVGQGVAGQDPTGSHEAPNASEHRVRLGPNPQFMITSNSLFSKTSGYLDEREKSIQD